MTRLTFGPGVPSLPVVVPVVDDSLVENDETLFGNLRLPEDVEDLSNILFQPGRAMATIQDNDSKQHDRECNGHSSIPATLGTSQSVPIRGMISFQE